MTLLKPFRGLRFDPARVDLAQVLVPPYDNIAVDERAGYYDRDPHNAIRLELTRDPRDEAKTSYSEVAETVAAWRKTGILIHDERPAIYGLRQRFTAPDGQPLTREGFFAALHLEDYDRRVVLPHEKTLSGPKADRLKLLRATRANLSVVFLLYDDRERVVSAALADAFAAPPLFDARAPDGVDQQLVRVDRSDAVETVRRVLADRPVVIADGHHRYETALRYRDERRSTTKSRDGDDSDAPFEWTLAYFTNAYAPGTLLLPIHRLILEGPAPSEREWTERLASWDLKRLRIDQPEALPGVLAEHLTPLGGSHAFVADDGSGILRVFSRRRTDDGELGIRVIHDEVVRGVFGLSPRAVRDGAVAYAKDPVRAALEVRAGRGAVALYLNPLTPEDVFRTTAAGELLPQKSTLFTPKIPTGLVFRVLDDEAAER